MPTTARRQMSERTANGWRCEKWQSRNANGQKREAAEHEQTGKSVHPLWWNVRVANHWQQPIESAKAVAITRAVRL